MPLRDKPIRRKLGLIVLITSGIAILLTCAGFITREVLTFRESMVQQLTTLTEVIAANSTAAIAFADQPAGEETLLALAADPQIEQAALYDLAGELFATYAANGLEPDAPPSPPPEGFRFTERYLYGSQPVMQRDGVRLGTLYIRANLHALDTRLQALGGIAALVMTVALLAAWLVSRSLQRQVSGPILALADAADAVSDRRDYAVRVPRMGDDEIGRLTDAFNAMLQQIQQQQTRLQAQLGRLDLLNRIARSTATGQDLPSVFAAALRHLEEHAGIALGCVLLRNPDNRTVSVVSVGPDSEPLAATLGLEAGATLDIEASGLAHGIGDELVYEPDVREAACLFAERLAAGGLRSLAIVPLAAEKRTLGILIAARMQPDAFSSGDCEFLRQMTDQVGLAAHQATLYSALQAAYEELRQTQQTVMQQERLRALGQIASGVAHDINNAISPVALYTESLLEREHGISERGRGYLTIIQRAIDDVAGTVARMREFYRPREPQLQLDRIELGELVEQVLELTRARWRDLPQERGAFIDVRTEFAPNPPDIMGAEGEIRDALTNLVFNAVDAMPAGGTLTIRTEADEDGVTLEVRDSGEGMSEDTRRRCMEPFFTTKGARGTGLGLAMVYGMVQRHNGSLEIDSAPGQGTAIRLRFPLPREDHGERLKRPRNATRVARQRILVVDDDPLILQSLRDALEQDGHAIVCAEGGREGVDAFRSALDGATPFDVVITDLGMPWLDGRQVAATVKGLAPRTPVLLLTGWGQRLLAEKEAPLHVDLVLSKPPKLRELREALARLLTPTDGADPA